ncbi:ras and Rab interactor 3-like [Bufo bufo]|uniref:ras and Rab interactor 3-like n=1 Tax=Bufo bufo TaxID=8384 RepID=UPI001ABEC3E2|nr:ras and Rab interactor 3-like [Bufo bufo]XP_040279787.1 ras and Rab interactor 3-like [Bufo bufo]XP_040279788.1 ras and Rab interactor 3-like [Bufo bufo]XP_040279789.1 ras and Rab interactor 3-like [Bufo bufo]
MKLDVTQSNNQEQQFCSIQVTSDNGALFIINPLYLHEHGDSWLTHMSDNSGKEKRKSVPWCFQRKLEQMNLEPAMEDINGHEHSDTEEQSNVYKAPSREDSDTLNTPETTESESCEGQDHLKPHFPNSTFLRKSVIRMRHGSNKSQNPEEGSIDIGSTLQKAHRKRHSLIPHRVSWIEEHEHISGASLKKSSSDSSLNSSDSFLLPPLPEMDSVSISSIEEEGEHSTLRHKKTHSHGLGDMVRHSLLAVSTALTGLISNEKHLGNRIQLLAEDSSTYLGSAVQTFISHMKKRSVQYISTMEMLQALRQQITNMKSYLLVSNEIWEHVEHQEMDESTIACIIETSLYKCLLKPLKSVIYSQLLEMHNRDGSLAKLLGNQKKMKASSLEQKPRSGVPGPSNMEKIQQKLSLMHMAYSPEKKIRLLLKVSKLIYEAMETSSGKKEAFGADDFLPVLIHVLLGCDLTSVQLDVEYMMELLDPTQLQGEGGYYLTTMFGALYHISSFNTISRKLSWEAQNSIRQWQRRRTIHHRPTFQKSSKFSMEM